VGQSFCEQWSRAVRGGSTLIVPTRRLSHAQGIRHLPSVVPVQADVHDPQALQQLVQGCDAVVNLVAILQGTPVAFERVHVTLPTQLAQACRQAHVAHVVHISALGVSDQAPSLYLRSKAAGEIALQVLQPGLTILRPSVIFGARDRFLNTFAGLQAIAPFVPLAGAPSRFQPVWVEDVAQAIVRALLHPATTPRLFECAGPDVFTLAELVRMAGQWSGHRRPIFPLPGPLATLQALAMEALPGEPLMSRDNLASMQVPNVASGTLPGLQSLGIEPSSLRAIGPGYLSAGQGCARLDILRARAGRR
jgi:NADH dehydrogenase